MNIGYIRVSTVDQNTERQEEALKKYRIDKVFIDKSSGKNTEREQFNAMLEFVRDGDCIYVQSFDRLSRNLADLIKTINTLSDKHVGLISIKENFDLSTPTGRLMLQLCGAISQFERENLLERQREGIAIAKEKGIYKGRKPNVYEGTFKNDVLNDVVTKKITVTEAARLLGVTRATVYNYLKTYNKGEV